jgi:hypothetical protein
MENKQTAVVWLLDQYIKYGGLITEDAIKEAYEMEREQIIEAHDAAYIAMNLCFRGFDRSVEYYEKTYGAQENGKPEELP